MIEPGQWRVMRSGEPVHVDRIGPDTTSKQGGFAVYLWYPYGNCTLRRAYGTVEGYPLWENLYDSPVPVR